MKKTSLYQSVNTFLIISGVLFLTFASRSLSAYQEFTLKERYEQKCNEPSDINQHLPHLYRLAKDCESAVEIGVRGVVSTWAVLYGLSENETGNRTYIGIDLCLPPADSFLAIQESSVASGIDFEFWIINDMEIEELEPTDLLFIDSLHTYCHLTYELEKFSPFVNKYIALHDTSAPWGELDDSCYRGDYSEYPPHINRTKRGLWLSVEDFLDSHSDWVLLERHYNNHGFTILKRVFQP